MKLSIGNFILVIDGKMASVLFVEFFTYIAAVNIVLYNTKYPVESGVVLGLIGYYVIKNYKHYIKEHYGNKKPF